MIHLAFYLISIQDSVDEKSNFVLLHATWDALGTGAELLNMRKRIKMPKVSALFYQVLSSIWL